MAKSKEQLLWRALDAEMRSFWTAQRHEDRYSPDVPDVSFALNGVDGWAELKVVDPTPKPDALLRIAHFTSGQRNWLYKRGRAGTGHCFLLAKAEPWFLLIRWHMLPELDRLPMRDWVSMCGFSRLDSALLIRRLTER